MKYSYKYDNKTKSTLYFKSLLKLIGTSEDNLNDKGKLTMEIYPLGSKEEDNFPHKKIIWILKSKMFEKK